MTQLPGCIWTVLVLQKSVGLADRGTVHIAGKGQRPRLRDERKKETIHKQNQSVNRPRPSPS